jgi:hypothetical protein
MPDIQALFTFTIRDAASGFSRSLNCTRLPMSAKRGGLTMEREREEGEGLHEETASGGSITVNDTDDPRYPEGSYYQSQQEPDTDKTTTIYSPDGDILDHNPK